ncbi:hypothetical protein DL96DRAFT_1818191 [Flagelloscypha sp. PMI_526]|nr:hypothetical protein DL96DRAFT_1818191 [Flagelloscypha sp. PMI_526]
MSDPPSGEFYVLDADYPKECLIYDLPSLREATDTLPHPRWASKMKDKVLTISTGDGQSLDSTKIAQVTWSDEKIHFQDGSEPVKVMSWMKPDSKLAKFVPAFSRCFPAKVNQTGKTYNIHYFKGETMSIYDDATYSPTHKPKALATYTSSFLKATSADRHVPLQFIPATIAISQAVSTQSEKDLLVAMILTIEQKCRYLGKGLPPVPNDPRLYKAGGGINLLNYGSVLVWSFSGL